MREFQPLLHPTNAQSEFKIGNPVMDIEKFRQEKIYKLSLKSSGVEDLYKLIEECREIQAEIGRYKGQTVKNVLRNELRTRFQRLLLENGWNKKSLVAELSNSGEKDYDDIMVLLTNFN